MSYTKIFIIEEELRALRKVTPIDIKDAKIKLLNYIKQGQVDKEDLRNTKIKFQSQLAGAPPISNLLAISAMVLSLLTGAFSISTTDKNYLAFLYLLFMLAFYFAIIYFLWKDNSVAKIRVTSIIMISIIEEIL